MAVGYLQPLACWPTRHHVYRSFVHVTRLNDARCAHHHIRINTGTECCACMSAHISVCQRPQYVFNIPQMILRTNVSTCKQASLPSQPARKQAVQGKQNKRQHLDDFWRYVLGCAAYGGHGRLGCFFGQPKVSNLHLVNVVGGRQ